MGYKYFPEYKKYGKDRMKLACDAMLGRLARWLRLSGYTTYYNPSASDEKLLEICRGEGSLLVTRDGELAARAEREGIDAILVEHGSIERQLAQLLNMGFEIKKEPSEALCPLCGSVVREAEKEELCSLPENLKQEHEEFYICKGCGKIYWKGSHWNNIRKRVEKIEDKLQNSKRRRGGGGSRETAE